MTELQRWKFEIFGDGQKNPATFLLDSKTGDLWKVEVPKPVIAKDVLVPVDKGISPPPENPKGEYFLEGSRLKGHPVYLVGGRTGDCWLVTEGTKKIEIASADVDIWEYRLVPVGDYKRY